MTVTKTAPALLYGVWDTFFSLIVPHAGELALCARKETLAVLHLPGWHWGLTVFVVSYTF